jgi:hypothetical protein
MPGSKHHGPRKQQSEFHKRLQGTAYETLQSGDMRATMAIKALDKARGE